MPFNPEQHAGLSYVDKPFKALLTKMRNKNKRTEKAQLEHIIEQASKGDTQ